VEKILIIQLNRMGDCVQTLPLLERLKEERPGCSLTVLCVGGFARMFERSPFIDRLVSLSADAVQTLKEKKEPKECEDLPELLEEFDLVVNFTNNDGGAFFIRNIKGKNKLGFMESGFAEGRVKGDWAKYLFASQKSRQANLFNLVEMQMGMAGVRPRPFWTYMPAYSSEVHRAHRLLGESGYLGKGKLIVFQLGASRLHRAWPVDSFASLAQSLLLKPDIEIALIGSPAEAELSESFRSRVPHPVIDLVGKTAIDDLPGLLKSCDLLVSNDTGTIHIAAAVGSKALGLYFSTAYFAETAPYGQGHMVLQAELPCSPCDPALTCPDMRCRQAITPDAALHAVEMMLEGKHDADFDAPNISAYRSEFLANGALVYSPVGPHVSEQWLTSLLWHSGWGAALGIGYDAAFVKRHIFTSGLSAIMAVKIDEIREALTGLRGLFARGVEIAGLALNELSRPDAGYERLCELSKSLQMLDRQILDLAPPTLKYYYMLEMTDIDYDDFSAVVEQIKRTYSRLCDLILAMISVFEDLRRSI